MFTLILASHKNLALGMKESVEYIMGPIPYIKTMTAYSDDNYDIDKDCRELIKGTENVVVVTDVLGGSVNNHWMEFVNKNGLINKVTIVAGMTMSLVMELCQNLDNPMLPSKLPGIIEDCKSGIINCTELMKEMKND